jgi:hypothetical protein
VYERLIDSPPLTAQVDGQSSWTYCRSWAGVRSECRAVWFRWSSVMACYDRTMPRPNLRDYFGNFSSSDLPLLEKLRLVAKNNAIKIKNGTSCCGNHGEPGC